LSLSKPKPPPEELTQLRTPLEIVNRQRWLLHYLALSTAAIKELREAFLDAKDAYNKAAYASQMSYGREGNADERKQKAQLENWDAYNAMQIAEKALDYARDKRKDLEVELGITQSESKLVIAEMSLAGRVNP